MVAASASASLAGWVGNSFSGRPVTLRAPRVAENRPASISPAVSRDARAGSLARVAEVLGVSPGYLLEGDRRESARRVA